MPLSLTVETFDRVSNRYELKFEDDDGWNLSNRLSLYKVKAILPGIEVRLLQNSIFSEYGNIEYKFKDSNTIAVSTGEHGTWLNTQEMKIPLK